MTHPTPTPDKDTQAPDKPEALPSLFNCIGGVVISGALAIALYFLTASIAHTFASKPLSVTNQTALNIAIAVRTLVVGVSTLATVVFGVIALGLVIVTIQVAVQQLRNSKATPSD